MKGKSDFFRNISQYVRKNPTEIVFGAYLFCIMMTSVCASVYQGNTFGAGLFIILVIYSVFSLVPKFHRWIREFSFTPHFEISRKKKLQVFGIAGGIAFVVLLLWFIGSFPGSFTLDSIDQYKQATNGTYNNWHPAWHTLLIFSLPLKLTGGWVGSIVLFQIIYFSLLIGYMASIIYVYSGRTYTFLSVSFILLNPYTLEILMYPTKDVAFAIAAGLCMLWTVKIYFTKGKWFDKIYRIILLAFVLANATLLRHNGILFSLFLLIALLYFMHKKKWFILFAATCIIFVCIRIPLYSYFNVGEPNERIKETMGLPLSVIVNVAKDCPDRLDKQTSEFIDDLMCNQPDWKTRHNISGLNSVKWDGGGINNDAIEKAGVIGILKMMCHCLYVAPIESIKAIGGLTIPVYGLEVNTRELHEMPENDMGIANNGVKIINELEHNYAYYVYKTPLQLFFTIGFTILVMLAVILFKSNFRSLEDWMRILLCLPIFTYNFGTMLFLSGPDMRFFYVSFLVCPLVVLIMCGKRPDMPAHLNN